MTLRDKYHDKVLFNIAADISINQLIASKYKSSEFLHINSFGDLKLEALKDTDYYYQKLLQEQKDNPKGELAQFIEGTYAGSMANHQFWKEFEALSDTDKELVKKQIEYQLKETANQMKNRGSIPGELSSIIDELFKPRESLFNWKSYLRRFAGGSTKIETKKIRRKESKRFSGNPGLKIKQKKNGIVAIDTSGSVSDDELKEFMNEIHHIYKTGTSLTIIHCDSRISHVQDYKGKWDGKVYGRGGTDFTEPCKYLNDHKSKYSFMIYLTDGEGSTSIKPLKKTLWVHSSISNINQSLPGLKIKLNHASK